MKNMNATNHVQKLFVRTDINVAGDVIKNVLNAKYGSQKFFQNVDIQRRSLAILIPQIGVVLLNVVILCHADTLVVIYVVRLTQNFVK
jgi:hypothetical protein